MLSFSPLKSLPFPSISKTLTPLSPINPNRSLSFPLASSPSPSSTAPVRTKRKRYRMPCPGEREGICEEMRFVAMKLRNDYNGDEERGTIGEGDTWQPCMEGFVKYLVDSKLVFDTVERIVNESSDVAYVYFRKNGLERSDSLVRDLDWLREQQILIPEPGSPGVTYAAYLEELAENSAPSFLSHYYNIYFAHLTGGVGIGKKVSEKLFEGRELEFYKWESDPQLLLKDVRETLNKLGEHWTRDEKKKCLKEAAKSFRYMGQIVRLMILL